MNNVNLIGRLTRDPEVRYSQSTNTAMARFSIAISRGKDKEGKERTDYPNILCIGKLAELAEKYLHKGQMVGISGRIQTGSYEKDGVKVYTTEVYTERLDIIEWPEKPSESDIPSGFSKLSEDIPF